MGGGASPVDASSGKQRRHRLNRGGDRQANSALWRIVFTRMACDPRTRAYVARRTAEGKTTREIMRCLKRYVAREVRKDVEESLPRRRSSSSTRAASARSCASLAASCAAAISPRAAAASRSRAFSATSSATLARSRAVSPDGDKGGVSGMSHHDQHLRTAIKPTRRAGRRRSADPRPQATLSPPRLNSYHCATRAC
jgi:Transposase IS116/IS110/IS902 family